MAQLLEHRVGDLAIARDVGALELHVDRRRQAEVQNLGHDVRRQKVEDDAGKIARQALPQRGDVVRGGAVVFFQRDEDVCIAGADQA